MGKSALRIAGAAIIATLILVGGVLLAGRSRVIGLVSTRDWVNFDIPTNAVPLNADLDATSEEVIVCNRGLEPWKDILVQIDGLYVAGFGLLKNGDCKRIAFSKFEMKSWKRIPAYSNMRVSRIEVLASTSKRGYASRSL